MIAATPIGFQPLQGHRVILERISPKHVAFLVECYGNDEFMDLYRLGQQRNQTEEQIKKLLARERAILPYRKIEWIIFRIINNDEKQPIGLASLADFKKGYQRAEFLMGILNPKYRATRLSLEASLLIMDFAFNQLKLNKLVAHTYEYNQYAQQNLLSFGFVQEGLLRQHIKSPKGFLDLYINGLLAEDFRKNQRLRRFSLRLLGRDITNKPIPPQQLSDEYINSKKAAIFRMLSSF